MALSAAGIKVGGGAYMPGTPALTRLRAHVAEEGDAFRKLTSGAALRRDWGTLDTAPLKGMPRGWKSDHPEADLLRLTRAFYMVDLPLDLVTSPDLLPEIVRRLRCSRPSWRTSTPSSPAAASPPAPEVDPARPSEPPGPRPERSLVALDRPSTIVVGCRMAGRTPNSPDLTDAEWRAHERALDARAGQHAGAPRAGPRRDGLGLHHHQDAALAARGEGGGHGASARTAPTSTRRRCKREQARGTAVRRLLARAFGGAAGDLAHFLIGSERLSERERRTCADCSTRTIREETRP